MSFSSPVSALRPLARELAPVQPRGSVRLLTPLLAVTVGAALLVLVLLHAHDFLAALDRALRANWELAAAGVLFEAASLAGYVALMHRVIAPASSELRF